MQPLTAAQAQSVATVRSLRGPSLPILITMLILRRPTDQSEITTLTGYTNKPVQQALNYMAALGYATRDHYRRWQLTPDIQLALPGFAQVGNFPTSAPTTTTCTLAPENSLQLTSPREETVVVVDLPPSRILSYLKTLLTNAHIGEPMRSRLLSLPHLTPNYLRAHLRRATSEKTDTALLIYRLLHADRAPDTSKYYDPCRSCSQVRPWDHLCPVCLNCPTCHPKEPCQ